ncbi:hypothetical protein CerSpe_111440 [Prunus speciosa]
MELFGGSDAQVGLSSLEAVMRKLGFDERWVQLTKSLVKSVELAVVINSKLGSYFKPTCGTHQDDTL